MMKKWKDKKGKWEFISFSRTGIETYCVFTTFHPNPNVKRKDMACSHIHFNQEISEEQLKQRLKGLSGYTPSKDVLADMMSFIKVNISNYQVQDRHYQLKDKSKAKRMIEDCYIRAMNNYRQGIETPLKYSWQKNRSYFDRFVSDSDKEVLIEAYKILNGHCYIKLDYGHTCEFENRMYNEISIIEKDKEIQKIKEHRLWLMNLLDIDPHFRKIVSHVLSISKSEGVNFKFSLDTELAYRLFGYCKNLNDWRIAHNKLGDILRPYGLNGHNTWTLVLLGRSYLKSGGMLPTVSEKYIRDKEEFYYNDKIEIDGRSFTINRIGRKYLYISSGGKVEISNFLAA